LGWLAAAVVESTWLVHATKKRLELRLSNALILPITIGCIASGVGWVISDTGGDIRSGLAGGSISVALYVAGLFVFRRALLIDAARFIAGSLRATRVELAAT
jgi:hypothetical protein